MWYIHTMEYYSAIKNEIIPFAATWMDREIIMLSEVSQTEKEKYHMTSLICTLKRNHTNELLYKTETDSQTLWMKLWLPGGKDGGIVREIGVNMYTLLYLKEIINKDLLYSTWNSAQYYGWEGSLGENGYMCMYGWVPLLSTGNYHSTVNRLYSNTK